MITQNRGQISEVYFQRDTSLIIIGDMMATLVLCSLLYRYFSFFKLHECELELVLKMK